MQFAPISGDQLVAGWKSRPISAEAFGVNSTDVAWVDRQCTAQSVACFQQPAQLTGGIARRTTVSASAVDPVDRCPGRLEIDTPYPDALAIHPHMERIPDLVKKLTEKVDGRDI